MSENRVYVVFRGRKPGIYHSWEETQEQVSGYSGAVYKRYASIDLAERAFASGDANYQDPPDGVIGEPF